MLQVSDSLNKSKLYFSNLFLSLLDCPLPSRLLHQLKISLSLYTLQLSPHFVLSSLKITWQTPEKCAAFPPLRAEEQLIQCGYFVKMISWPCHRGVLKSVRAVSERHPVYTAH